jgi:hypothetical protein
MDFFVAKIIGIHEDGVDFPICVITKLHLQTDQNLELSCSHVTCDFGDNIIFRFFSLYLQFIIEPGLKLYLIIFMSGNGYENVILVE